MIAIMAILLITLSNDGYWLAERPATIDIQWASPQASPGAALVWEFGFTALRLADGKVEIGRDGASISIEPPEVRVPTEFRWLYRVVRKDNKRTLTTGEAAILVYPRNQLDGVAERLTGKKVIVWDRSGRLSAVLVQAGIQHDAIDHASGLALVSPDVILVGPDTLPGALFEQAPLINHARAGSNVIIFAQTRLSRLAGYQLQRRLPTRQMEWRMDHPLLVDLSRAALDSCSRRAGADTRAVRLPKDEAALEIGYWRRDSAGREPAPIDALLVTKAIGAGRLVLCQAPLDRWPDDPRSRIFLRNTLNYALSRPEPTPRPSERKAGDASGARTSRIGILSGDAP